MLAAAFIVMADMDVAVFAVVLVVVFVVDGMMA